MTGRPLVKAAPRWIRLAPDLAGVAGLVCLCTGAALITPALGWLVAGASCLVIAWRLAVLEQVRERARGGSSS